MFALLVGGSAVALEPADFNVGAMQVTPTLGAEIYHDDNYLRSSDVELSSLVSKVTPAISGELRSGTTIWTLDYQLVDFRYSDSSVDDFTDHQGGLSLSHEFNARNSFAVSYSRFDGHEERGKGLSEGPVAAGLENPIEYTLDTVDANYELGSDNSRGRLVVAAQGQTYSYDNARDITKYRDRDQSKIGATLYWQLSPKVEALVEMRETSNSYDFDRPSDALGSLDSDQTDYFVGLQWRATAKTSGALRVGRYDRSYSSSSRTDSDGSSWEADVQWKIKDYSVLSFTSARASRETTGIGHFIDAEDHSVAWNHEFSSLSSMSARYSWGSDNYEGSEREDDRINYQLSYTRSLKRWLDVSLGYRYGERDSSNNDNDYKQNIFYVAVEMSL